jgi:hypothetical protein
MNAPMRPPTQSTLFDPSPDVRTPAPSVPATTSEAAADAIQKSPLRRASLRKIMLHLAELQVGESRSMAEIGAVVGIPVHVMCARLRDLEGWVEAVEGDRASSAKPSLRVNGYRLTARGRARVQQAQGPLT